MDTEETDVRRLHPIQTPDSQALAPATLVRALTAVQTSASPAIRTATGGARTGYLCFCL